MRIRRSETFCECVPYASQFHNDTHTATRDETGTGRGGFEQHLARTVPANNRVGQGIFDKGNANQRLLRVLNAFPYGFWDFVSLPQAVANMSRTIPGHNNGAETETAPTLDHFTHTIDMNDFLLDIEFVRVNPIIVSRHRHTP